MFIKLLHMSYSKHDPDTSKSHEMYIVCYSDCCLFFAALFTISESKSEIGLCGHNMLHFLLQTYFQTLELFVIRIFYFNTNLLPFKSNVHEPIKLVNTIFNIQVYSLYLIFMSRQQ